MASSAKQGYDEFVSDHSDDDNDSDDSLKDPTFDIIEGTRSRLSSLSINKKSKPRVFCKGKIEDGEGEGDSDVVKDLDSYQTVEEIIKGGQLDKLKVHQCKVYLRKHELRLTGNKDILIQRIREHLEVIDGGGERKYPVSSFLMNCKGDACTGDVVLFEQNVYEVFNIASRSASGPPCGTRLVAGRIVKESYGAEKQQHTFTIEVLWSKGEKPLPPLHQLLIKGRNLYRLKTMRQEWEDETERQKMLSEKHARGHVARWNRETRIRRKMLRSDRILKAEDERERMPTKITLNPIASQQPPEDKLNNLQSHNFQPKVFGELKSCNHKASARQEGPVSVQMRPKYSLDANAPLAGHHHLGREPLTSRNCNLPRDPPRTAIYNRQMKLEKSITSAQGASLYERHANHNFSINNLLVPGGFSSNPLSSSTQRHVDGVNVWSPKKVHSRRENLIGHGNPVHGHLQDKKQPCRYFAQGRCYYGDRCKWLHDDSGNQKQQ